jgi:hypothetical protein
MNWLYKMSFENNDFLLENLPIKTCHYNRHCGQGA